MMLVDTSVWVDHLRREGHELAARLEEGSVLCHPFVTGELACGSLSNRARLLHLLDALPQAQVAEHQEVLQLVGARRIHGRGLGWIDVHLLASALLEGCALWTLDQRLREVAARLGVAVSRAG